MNQIKVVSFNIRTDVRSDGVNCFDLRKPLVLDFFKNEKPDIIGFQEVRPHMYVWLKENMPDYYLLGSGRGADYRDEACCIAVKKNEFDIMSLETFWLSDTPDIPGSRFTTDQSACPRIAVIATLIHLGSGKIFNFANTHLDHVGEQARVDGARLIVERMSGRKFPFILTGDMNARSDSKAIEYLKSIEGCREATEEIKGTFHGYGRLEEPAKIDYIFTSAEISGNACLYDMYIDKEAGIYISDHYPVGAVISL